MTYRLHWDGGNGFARPVGAHVTPGSDGGYAWTATDRYGETKSGTAPSEHEARIAAEAHALRVLGLDVG